jgi:FkbM family methyltransferase
VRKRLHPPPAYAPLESYGIQEVSSLYVSFPNARILWQKSGGLSRLRLLAAALARSRPPFRPWVKTMLRVTHGRDRIPVEFKSPWGTRVRCWVRVSEVESDMLVVTEIGVADNYRLGELPSAFVPQRVVDAGGNIGLFTIIAHHLWPEAAKVVYEPVPHNLGLLKENLACNGVEAKIIAACLGKTEGVARFYLRAAGQGGIYAWPWDKDVRGVCEVPVRKLSADLRPFLGEPILIKLDIEGAELDVVEELFSAGVKGRIIIVGELHNVQEKEAYWVSLFGKNGWRLRWLHRGGREAIFHAFGPEDASAG